MLIVSMFVSMQDRATTKCVLAAFRYLVTGIVALLLVLLLVELGAAIGAAVERGQEDLPVSGNFRGSVTGASPQVTAALWRARVEVSLVFDRAELELATLYSGAATRSAQPSASIVVRF